MPEESQQIWDDYFGRIKRRRLAAAELLWNEAEAAGASEDTVFALDFTHFGANREQIDGLAQQLSANYTIQVSESSEEDYWDVKGTTRPEGIALTKDQHTAWVEFMVEVAQSYGCVFSEWKLEAPALGRTFQSAHLDDD